MATTDARTGFRLPWSSDTRQADEDSAETAATGTASDDASPTRSTAASGDSREGASDSGQGAATEVAATRSPSAVPARKPNKFLAELTKAMQAAAETAREESLGRLSADAKSFIEQIHERSAEEAAAFRSRADEDVEKIREWSKAEIARIREETEQRISDRRAQLETDVERHAARIEQEIERVQGRVADFEADMARFFERLLAEEDPTHFAAMAEKLPEPPSFDVAEALAEAATLPLDRKPSGDAAVATQDGANAGAAEASTESAASVAESTDAKELPAEEAAPADVETVSGDSGGATAEATAGATETPKKAEADPRLAMLGLDAEFAAAAEAEALVFDASAAPDEGPDAPPIGEDTLAARLAGLLPSTDEPSAELARTQVVVVGLVSVASIAGFKRHLGRLAGVQAVGVSSGPDGEFVFAVTHTPDAALGDAIPAIPNFQARVTGTGDGVVNVTAHDPESNA